MTDPGKSLSLPKKFGFASLTLVLAFCVLEVTLRCAQFQFRTHSSPLAIISGINAASSKLKELTARAYNDQYQGLWGAFFSGKNRDLLAQFKQRYEDAFRDLVAAARGAQTKLIVLYIPTSPPGDDANTSAAICQPFYRDLAAKYSVPFLDVSGVLGAHEWQHVTLTPENGHLSRLGNQLIAAALNEHLQAFHTYRSPRDDYEPGSIYGDLPPSASRLWVIDRRMPYRVVTNSAGFRNTAELVHPKSKQRILVLGDSFTFGPYLPNHDTFPSLLQKLNPGLEIINAGVSGYTITDEASLFIEKAQYVSPDITILRSWTTIYTAYFSSK